MSTIRTRLAALEARLGGDEAARRQRRIEAMTDEELDAEIAACDAVDASTDEEIRASVTRGDLTAAQAEDFIALRAAWRAERETK